MFKKISLYFTSLVFLLTTIGSAYAVTLKASHQWPGTPRADGSFDPRHEMVQIIADEMKKANVGVDIRIYPAKSLYKPKEQWKPMTTGQLDISAFPLAYASKFHPEFDATLMPGTVKNHDHALRFNKGPMMTEIKRIINDAGVVVLSDAWLGGGFASKTKCIKNPSDAKGQVMRAAGKAFNQMLEAAGAGIQSMPSSEIYNGLQTGVLDGANTSSGSFVSYRIYEQVKCATPPGDYGLWFMYEPILMSKKSFDALDSKQQKALMKAGKVAEKYMTKEAAGLDTTMEKAYKEAGVKLSYMKKSDFDAWLALDTPWSLWKFLENLPRVEILLHSIHYFDFIRSILGNPIGVKAKTLGFPGKKTSNTRTAAILDYGKDIRCALTINHDHSFGRKFQACEFRICGTKGAAYVHLGVNLNYPEGEPDKLEINLGQNTEIMMIMKIFCNEKI